MKALDSVMEAQSVPRVWSSASKTHQQHACTVVETDWKKKSYLSFEIKPYDNIYTKQFCQMSVLPTVLHHCGVFFRFFFTYDLYRETIYSGF